MIVRILEAHPSFQLEPHDRPWKGKRFRVGRTADNDLIVHSPEARLGGRNAVTFARENDGTLVVEHNGSLHRVAVHGVDGTSWLEGPGRRALAVGDRIEIYATQGPLALALTLVDDRGRATPDDATSRDRDGGTRTVAVSSGDAVPPVPIGTFSDDALSDDASPEDTRPKPAAPSLSAGMRAFLDGTVSQHLLMVRVLHSHDGLPLTPSDWVFSGPTFSIGTAKENDLSFPQIRGLAPMGPTSLRLERDAEGTATVVHLTPATSGVLSSYRVLVQRADSTRRSLDRPGEQTSGVRPGDVLELETYEAGRVVLLRLAMIRLVRREARGPRWAELRGSGHDVIVHRMGAARQRLFEVMVDGWPIPCWSKHTETIAWDYPRRSVNVVYEGDRPFVKIPVDPEGALELKPAPDGTWVAETSIARPAVETPDNTAYARCLVRFVFTEAFDEVRVWVDEFMDLSR